MLKISLTRKQVRKSFIPAVCRRKSNVSKDGCPPKNLGHDETEVLTNKDIDHGKR
jgi:hypothetical protein